MQNLGINLKMESASATKIQALFRSYKVRQKLREAHREYEQIFKRLETNQEQDLVFNGLFSMPETAPRKLKENTPKKNVES